MIGAIAEAVVTCLSIGTRIGRAIGGRWPSRNAEAEAVTTDGDTTEAEAIGRVKADNLGRSAVSIVNRYSA